MVRPHAAIFEPADIVFVCPHCLVAEYPANRQICPYHHAEPDARHVVEISISLYVSQRCENYQAAINEFERQDAPVAGEIDDSLLAVISPGDDGRYPE